MTDFSQHETEPTIAASGAVAPPPAESAQLRAGGGVLMQRMRNADEAAA